MNIKTICFLTLMLGVIASSCIKEISINSSNGEGGEKKIVLNHIFSNNKKDTFYLSYTHSIGQPKINEANASIQLWEEESYLTDLNNFGNGRYQIPSSTNLNPKTNYRFRVFKNGELLSSAVDYFPKSVSADSAYFEIIPSPSGDDLIQFTFSFQDLLDEKQYYEVLFLNAEYDGQKDSSKLSFFSFARVPDLAIDNEGILEFEPKSFFFSDELFDGQLYQFDMQMEFTLSEGKTIKGKFQQGINETTFLIFRSISKNYFDFKKSWVKHRFNKVTQDTPDEIDIEIIFPGEPAPLFSNVMDGFGIVAGYQETIIPIIER